MIKTETEKYYLERLELTPKWPMYMVVVPNAIGIYDDMFALIQDTRYIGNMHYCTKYKAIECIHDIEGYYKYHYPNSNIKRIYIPKKNQLFKVN